MLWPMGARYTKWSTYLAMFSGDASPPFTFKSTPKYTYMGAQMCMSACYLFTKFVELKNIFNNVKRQLIRIIMCS
jgi:hypothetical protein